MGNRRFALTIVVGMMLLGLLLSFRQIDAQETRKGSELLGSIVAPLDQRKTALSSLDKIVISLDRPVRIKVGDPLEIFQMAFPNEKNQNDSLYRKVGEGSLLEIINPQLVFGVIDASIKEIAVGDRIYFKNSH